MDKPSVYFALMLTALRNEGYTLMQSDGATAIVLANALDTLQVRDPESQDTADALAQALNVIAVDCGNWDTQPREPTNEELSDLAHTVPDRNVPDYTPTLPSVRPGAVEVELSPEQAAALQSAGGKLNPPRGWGLAGTSVEDDMPPLNGP